MGVLLARYEQIPYNKQYETAGHANIGNIEYREVDEREIDEVNNVELTEAVDSIAQAARTHQGERNRFKGAWRMAGKVFPRMRTRAR